MNPDVALLSEMRDPVVPLTKMALVLNHLKNNRIEYLVLVLFSHVLGLTSKASEHVAGVCA